MQAVLRRRRPERGALERSAAATHDLDMSFLQSLSDEVAAVTDRLGPSVLHVRSLNGTSGRWYREAIANPEVVLHVAGAALPARAVHTPDPDSVAAASAGLQRKYADSPYLESMIRDDILEATLRFVPR